MNRSIAAMAVATVLTLAGCGVTSEDEPEELTVTPPALPTTTAVTLSPRPPITSSPPPPSSPSATTPG
jgi:hypothetical protein